MNIRDYGQASQLALSRNHFPEPFNKILLGRAQKKAVLEERPKKIVDILFNLRLLHNCKHLHCYCIKSPIP